MTCDEFRAIRATKTPEQCTKAELASTLIHRLSCDACHRWQNANDLRLTPGSREQTQRLAAELFQDPEAKAQIVASFKSVEDIERSLRRLGGGK